MDFVYHVPTKIVFGSGCLKRLHEYQMPGKKALIVITKDGLMKKLGYLEILQDELKKAGVTFTVFDGITPNPETKDIDRAAAMCRDEDCDFVIGLGGGSSMDAAKAIALAAVNPDQFWTYSSTTSGGKKGFVEPIPLSTVEITTTAATGSEVDPWFVISNNETNEKTAFGDDGINHPTIAFIDPELMTSIPPFLTAFQGFDILYHAVESYLNIGADKMSRMFAKEAIQLVFAYLPRCVENGNDLEARENISLASSLAAFQMRCLNLHNMEHVLSAFHPELPHGIGLILLSDAYFDHLIDKGVADADFAYLGKLMGSDKDDPSGFKERMQYLKEKCHVADLKMSDYGIKEEELKMFSQNVHKMTDDHQRDPVIMDEDDFYEIYKRSFK